MKLHRLALCLTAPVAASAAEPASPAMPSFRMQEIDASLAIGYGVVIADVNGDRRPDIVVADKARVLWWENPTWKPHVILQGKTKPDNVCLDAHDVDRDGKLDLVLGAAWNPGDTRNPGTLQWLRQGDDPTKEWELFPIDNDEPTVHRARFADVDGDGRAELISVPLHARGASQANNFADGGVRVEAFAIPADPRQPAWPTTLISDSLPVMHNFHVVDVDGDGKADILTVSYEGVHLHRRGADGKWSATKLAEGDQAAPRSRRGASEIKLGRLAGGEPFIATIEPWHGNQVVVYTRAADGTWKRTVIDSALAWGHAVWVADLDGRAGDELIIGVRDPLPGGRAKAGVRIYRPADAEATTWSKVEIDPGGVAVEDLSAADLNGDGKVDIVAVGRATKNVRIYWNEGAR